MEINVQIRKEAISAKTGKCPLIFSLYYQTTRLRPPVGISVKLEAFDVKKQRINAKEKNYKKLNEDITRIKSLVIDVVRDIEQEGEEVNQKEVSLRLKNRVNVSLKNVKVKPKKSESKEPSTFWEVLEHYRTKSGNTSETIRKWNQIEGHLKAFRPNFDFKDITEQFYNDYFLDYLVNAPICDNTIDKHIAQLKAMCSYAKRFNNINIPADYIDFKRVYKNPSRLSLTWDEVKAIEAFKPLTEEQQQAKDMFIISCYTGLRWQNVSDLKPHNFVEEGGQLYLNVVTYKNGNPLRFPLSRAVKKIIEKYQREIPKSYNSDVNKEIQGVARACKLNDIVYTRKMFKKKVIEEPSPKWKKVTMHVARHTFACEFLRRNKAEGLSALKALSGLLGHSSTAVTEIYWNMVGSERDKMLMNTFD